jgi:hypothetical protein
MKLRILFSAMAVSAFALSVPASAGVISMNFAGLDGNAQEGPANYYDGGYGTDGSGPGPNYGIVWGADTLSCSGQPGGACNTAEIPGGPGANSIFFLSGAGDVMDKSSGFTTGFSFYYTSPFTTGTVTVWSGVDGTGTLLATLVLGLTPDNGNGSCQGTNYCPYEAAGVTFSGTAESAVFSGAANGIGFADITLGSATPAPEPMTLSLLGAGLLGAGAFGRFRRKKTTSA